MSAFISC